MHPAAIIVQLSHPCVCLCVCVRERDGLHHIDTYFHEAIMTSGKLKLIKYNESNVCNFVLSFLFFAVHGVH